MKTIAMLVLVAGALSACNNDSSTAQKKDDAKDVKVAGMATTEKVDLPYKVEGNGEWESGSRQNLKVALDALKNWEQNDMKATMNSFADSVELRFDGFEKKLSKAEAEKTLSAQRNAYRDIKVDVNDFESVRSSDGKQEWVSIWYKQKFQDLGNKWDSVSIMDDVRLVNGKITVLDEKTRHFGKK